MVHPCNCSAARTDKPEEITTTPCPECGSPTQVSDPADHPAKRILTDSYIKAAYEVLAEEGAIWSGAR